MTFLLLYFIYCYNTCNNVNVLNSKIHVKFAIMDGKKLWVNAFNGYVVIFTFCTSFFQDYVDSDLIIIQLFYIIFELVNGGMFYVIRLLHCSTYP